MKGKRTPKATRRIADALVDLPGRFTKVAAKPADQVPAVLDAMTKRLLDIDPELEKVILDHPRSSKNEFAQMSGDQCSSQV